MAYVIQPVAIKKMRLRSLVAVQNADRTGRRPLAAVRNLILIYALA